MALTAHSTCSFRGQLPSNAQASWPQCTKVPKVWATAPATQLHTAVQPSASTRSTTPSRCFGLYTGSRRRSCCWSAAQHVGGKSHGGAARDRAGTALKRQQLGSTGRPKGATHTQIQAICASSSAPTRHHSFAPEGSTMVHRRP